MGDVTYSASMFCSARRREPGVSVVGFYTGHHSGPFNGYRRFYVAGRSIHHSWNTDRLTLRYFGDRSSALRRPQLGINEMSMWKGDREEQLRDFTAVIIHTRGRQQHQQWPTSPLSPGLQHGYQVMPSWTDVSVFRLQAYVWWLQV